MAQTVDASDVSLTAEEAERAALIDFGVDGAGELPLGTQLAWKIRSMVARGALREGDRLPSVRELAQFSGVNVNTVRSVYGDLEREGTVRSEHGRGTFVGASGDEGRVLASFVEQTLAAALERGIDPMRLAEACWAEASAADRPELTHSAGPGDEATGEKPLRKELRRQIARLEAELAPYTEPDRASPPPVPSAAPAARLLSVAELERTRDEMVDRLTDQRKQAEGLGDRDQRARRHIEGMLADPGAHRGETVIGAGGDGSTTRVVPRYGPLGAILGWWRVEVRS